MVIEPAANARPQIAGRLTVAGATGVTLRGFSFAPIDPYWDLLVDACSTDVTFDGLVGRRFLILEGTKRITIRNGAWGGYSTPGDQDSAIGTALFEGPSRICAGQLAQPAQDILIDSVTFHDVFWGVPQADWGRTPTVSRSTDTS